MRSSGMMGVGLLAGPANVIMQLARPGVGYGVVESRVESGRIDRHPIKRARTTFTYLAVAAQGTDEQKAAYRRAVNGAHAQVYSTKESPVSYNAFDPELQMWVAACMYKGVDRHLQDLRRRDGRRGRRAHLFEEGVALGTMLQVPAEMWPADQRGVRRVLGGVARQGAHRRHGARLPLADRRRADPRGEAARVPAAQAGRFQPVDHGRLSAATVPRRDAARHGTTISSAGSIG